MTVKITTYALGLTEKEQVPLRQKIEELFSSRKGNWEVSIIGDIGNTIWQVEVKGPGNFKWSQDFIGEDGGHSAKIICDMITEALLSPDLPGSVG